MNENYLMLNGKRVELTDEQIEKLGLKVENKDFFEKVNEGEIYYRIEGVEVAFVENHNNVLDKERYDVANYCTDYSLMQQRALHETLSRLLWRFSMQNDEDKIDWDNEEQYKYIIMYDHGREKFCVDNWIGYKYQGTVHFYSEEIAQRAIDEIVLPFIDEHPDFVW